MRQFATFRGGATRSFNPFLGPGQGFRSGPTPLGRQQLERPARAIGKVGRALGKNPLAQATALNALNASPVSYTHLTLPTICSV